MQKEQETKVFKPGDKIPLQNIGGWKKKEFFVDNPVECKITGFGQGLYSFYLNVEDLEGDKFSFNLSKSNVNDLINVFSSDDLQDWIGKKIRVQGFIFPGRDDISEGTTLKISRI